MGNWLSSTINSALQCEFYQTQYKMLNSGITLKEFKKLPIIDKEIVRRNLNKFINQTVNRHKLIEDFTSGSTGTPLTCYRTREEQVKLSFILSSQRKRFNPKVNQSRRIEFGSFEKRISINRHINTSTCVLSSLYNGTFDMRLYLNKIIQFNPTFIQGFPSILCTLAKYILSEGIQLNLRDLTYIEARAEELTNEQKEIIEEAFNVPLANHYGSKEFWTLAYSCNYGNLHIIDDAAYIEILDERGEEVPNGCIGEIVVTSKIIKSMPLIRYKIGDVGSITSDKCDCGSSGSVINLQGRVSADIVTKNGLKNRTLLSPIWRYINNKSDIYQAQIVQTRIDSFLIKYTCKHELSENIKNDLTQIIKRNIDPNSTVKFEKVERISGEKKKKIDNFIPFKQGSGKLEYK